jgi:hypothetical protein
MNAQELKDAARPDKSAPHAAPAAAPGKGHRGHAKAGAPPAMSADLAHRIGITINDATASMMPKMIRCGTSRETRN